ncbi:MAG: T9SS type A sorting domain-containing protein [Bacteroidota bacterium]
MKTLITTILFTLTVIAVQAQTCQAGFTAYVDTSYTAVFTDQSTSQSGNVVSWSWSFPGGVPATSVSQNPVVNFPLTGTYLVCLTITTDDSCTSTFCDSLHVIDPCLGFNLGIAITLTSGYGVADGSANALVNGGTPPYSYIWSTTATTSMINGLQEGLYCVTVTDNNGCTLADCDSVYCSLDTMCNIHVIAYVTHESSTGAADGAINISVLWGGTPPYTFLWSNAATTEDINGLSEGYYTVTIMDSDTCVSTETYYVWCDTINNYPCQMYVSGSITHVSTTGGNDGAIDITTIGGNPPFSYYWNTGAITQDISGLTTGVYTVCVGDSLACTTTASFYVSEPTVPTQWDTLYSSVIDTCVGFVYDSIYVYSWYMIDSTTVSVTWAATGGGQIALFTVEYIVSQPGNYYVVLAINCGTKVMEIFLGAIYVDYSMLTGIENTPEFLNISLYPNPVNERLNLEIPLNCRANLDVSILNISGQIVQQESFACDKGMNRISMDTGTISQGVYLLRINGTGINQVIRFVK